MAELTYPNRANTMGFPLLEAQAAVADGKLVLTFQPHAAMDNQWTGGFWVKVANAVTATTEPVVFATQGVTGNKPLYYFSGAPVLADYLVTTGGGVMLCFYDASSKKLQII